MFGPKDPPVEVTREVSESITHYMDLEQFSPNDDHKDLILVNKWTVAASIINAYKAGLKERDVNNVN